MGLPVGIYKKLYINPCIRISYFLLIRNRGNSLSTVKNYDSFEPDSTIKICEYPPQEDQIRISVVEITMFDDSKLKDTSAINLSKAANLPSIMADSVENSLVGAVSIFNTTNREKKEFMEILNKCELEGACKFNKNKPLDYAIMGSINSVDVEGVFVQEHKDKNRITGKEYSVPDRCNYTATISGSIKIFSFPTVELVSSLILKKNLSKAVDTKDSKCPHNTSGLIRETAEKAIQDIISDVKNQMPPKGYVIERRVNVKDANTKYIFRLSIGTKLGLKAGDEVKIYTLETLKDQFAKKDIIAKREIATGKVTDQIGEQYSWIIIDDPVKAEKIKMGDYIKINYPAGFFKDITKGLNDIKKNLGL